MQFKGRIENPISRTTLGRPMERAATVPKGLHSWCCFESNRDTYDRITRIPVKMSASPRFEALSISIVNVGRTHKHFRISVNHFLFSPKTKQMADYSNAR